MSQRDQQDGRQERFMQPQRQRRQAQDTEFASEPGMFQPQRQRRQAQDTEFASEPGMFQQPQQQRKKQQQGQQAPTTDMDNE